MHTNGSFSWAVKVWTKYSVRARPGKALSAGGYNGKLQKCTLQSVLWIKQRPELYHSSLCLGFWEKYNEAMLPQEPSGEQMQVLFKRTIKAVKNSWEIEWETKWSLNEDHARLVTGQGETYMIANPPVRVLPYSWFSCRCFPLSVVWFNLALWSTPLSSISFLDPCPLVTHWLLSF